MAGCHIRFQIYCNRKEDQTMELLTHIIFVLNLLKTLLNHFF